MKTRHNAISKELSLDYCTRLHQPMNEFLREVQKNWLESDHESGEQGNIMARIKAIGREFISYGFSGQTSTLMLNIFLPGCNDDGRMAWSNLLK